MTADLSALIARLEAAEVGSRELGYEVLMALGWRRSVVGHFYGPLYQWSSPDFSPHLISGDEDKLPNPVLSLDAALALAERVLPGCSPGMSQNVHSRDWFTWLGYTEDGEAKLHAQTFGKTPALALCIAVLKAKQEQRP